MKETALKAGWPYLQECFKVILALDGGQELEGARGGSLGCGVDESHSCCNAFIASHSSLFRPEQTNSLFLLAPRSFLLIEWLTCWNSLLLVTNEEI